MSNIKGPGVLRPPREIRSVRQQMEERTEAPSRTAYLEDEPYKQALEQLLPQIAAESEQAAKVTRTVFYYYRKRRVGRRCTCFIGETSPDGRCQICFSSGHVGGWDMHGCKTEVIDTTAPNLRLVNIETNAAEGIRPLSFVLSCGYTKGFIETDIQVMSNCGITQKINYIVGRRLPNTSVRIFVRAPSESSFVDLTEKNLNARLNNSKLIVRIEIQRQNTTIESPRFSHLMLRYQLLKNIFVYADMNLPDESFELGEIGFFDAFSVINLYFPRSIDYINAEDFLIRLSDAKRFLITGYQKNNPLGVLLSHTARARILIPGTDHLLYFP